MGCIKLRYDDALKFTFGGRDERCRFGFNGQKKDDELKGEGNSIDYKYRMADTRLGRFFAVDPLASKYPELTTYQVASNNTIGMIELEGLEGVAVNENIDNLVIVIQGMASPYDDKVTPDHSLVDNIDDGKGKITSVRDEQLGALEGMAQVALKNAQVVTYTSSSDGITPKDVLSTVYNFKVNHPNGKVVIIGHSLGAVNANDVAKQLSLYKLNIDLLISLDPASPQANGKEDLDLPSNEQIGWNLYASPTKFSPSGGKMNQQSKEALSQRIFNTHVGGVGHTSIDNTTYNEIGFLVYRFLQGGTTSNLAKDILDLKSFGNVEEN